MPASTLVALPGAEGYPDMSRLAFLPWLRVAAGAVERSALRPGDRLVVTGATGQLGGVTVLLALALGVGRIAAVGRNTASLDDLAALDPRVRPVRSRGDRAEDAAAITDALGGDADVTSATLDDPDAVLARAEATNGLGYVALTP